MIERTCWNICGRKRRKLTRMWTSSSRERRRPSNLLRWEDSPLCLVHGYNFSELDNSTCHSQQGDFVVLLEWQLHFVGCSMQHKLGCLPPSLLAGLFCPCPACCEQRTYSLNVNQCSNVLFIRPPPIWSQPSQKEAKSPCPFAAGSPGRFQPQQSRRGLHWDQRELKRLKRVKIRLSFAPFQRPFPWGALSWNKWASPQKHPAIKQSSSRSPFWLWSLAAHPHPGHPGRC